MIVGSDAVARGYLYAFERSTGTVKWKHPFAGGVGATVLRRGDTAFAVSAAGEVVAVDIESGKIAWRTPPSDMAGDRLLDPVLDGDRFLVGWRAGYVEALDTATGRRVWLTSLGARLNTSLAALGSTLVVGSLDGRLHRLSRTDGSAVSRLDLQGMPYGDLVAEGQCLLVLSMAVDEPSPQAGRYALSCFDPALSKTLWSFRSEAELSTFRPLVHGGRVRVGSEGSLIALDLGTGAEVSSCPVKGVPRGLGASGDLLYAGTLSGLVLSLDPARCAGPRR